MKKRRVVATVARRVLLDAIDPIIEETHRSPRHGNYRDPTTELFYLLLTVKTRIADVRPHLQALKCRCGSWNELADIHPDELRSILDPLGFGKKRAALVVAVANRIRHDFGRVSLVPLKSMPLERVLDYLRSLPFVGEKVARCVALYSMDADISPMDANATRVLARVGVLPRGIEPKQAHPWIDRLVQPGASYRLHVNLVAHGVRVCRPAGPRCPECALAPRCRWARTGR
jgi:endonuclease III